MNILSSMLNFLLNKVLGVENRMGGTYLPNDTNINNLTKEQSGWWVYNRSNVSGTFPITDEYGTIGHIQGTSSNVAMQILRSNGQSYNSTIVYVRYKLGGTWGTWQRYVSAARSDLAVNWVNNSYLSESDASLLYAYKKGGSLFLKGNIHLSSVLPTGTADVKIATISGWNAIPTSIMCVPAQSGNVTLVVNVSTDGNIVISNYSGTNTTANAWFRFMLTVPCAVGYE